MAQTTPAELPPLSTRRVMVATLVVAAVVLAFWLLWRFHKVILILFVAIVISTAIRPFVTWLHHKGLPRPAGIILVYLIILALIAGFIVVGIPLVADQVTTIAGQIPTLYERARHTMLTTPNLLIWRIGTVMPPELTFIAPREPLGDEATVTTLAQAWAFLRLGIQGVFGVIATLVLAFYWTLDGERTRRSLFLLVPLDKRENVRELVTVIERKVGSFIIGQLLLSVLVGGMSLIAYSLIGLPYALALAIFAGIMEAVPFIGPVIGAAPAVLVGFSISPAIAIWTLIAAIVIQQIESIILVPRVMNRTVGVHPLVTILALIAFGSLFGIVGALTAIPLAAVIQILLDRYLLNLDVAEQEKPSGRDHLSVLRYETQELVQDVRKQVRHKQDVASADSDQVEDSLEAIAIDLDSILAQPGPSGEAT